MAISLAPLKPRPRDRADGRPVAEQWLVEGGFHAWFGGDKRGSFTQTVGLDASRVMVRFFLAETT